MSNRVFLGIDVGSASFRAGLFGAHCRRLALSVPSVPTVINANLTI